jgi:hypothetical protein
VQRLAITRRLRAPSPAVVISLIALFVALGGTAYASGLISGKQIVNHSIPAKKLTAAAVRALHGQRGPVGPGARFFLATNPPDSVVHRLTTTNAIDVSYKCDTNSKQVHFFLTSHGEDYPVFVSGDYAEDGALESHHLQGPDREPHGGFTGNLRLNLNVIASAHWAAGISRIDLAGENNGAFCRIWGLITPGTL